MTEQLYDYCSRCLWIADYTCGCEDGRTVFPLVQMTHEQAAIARGATGNTDATAEGADSAGLKGIAQP